MKLAEAVAQRLADTRRHVTSVCGPVFVATIEGMGYRLVPVALVDTFLKVLEKSDEAKAAEIKGG